MAEVALTAVINSLVGIAGSLVVTEGSRLYWLPEDIQWFQREFRNIRSYLVDIDAKQQVVNEAKANAIKNIRHFAYDLEDILDIFLPKMEPHRREGLLGCLKNATCIIPHWYTAHKFAMAIEGIRRRVEEINLDIATCNTDNGESIGSDTWDRRRPILHLDEPHVIGFDDDVEKLGAKLRSTKIRFDVISIVGMPGIGKTTLAKRVFKSNQRHFECSAFVYVSQDANKKEITREMARQVGLAEVNNLDDVELYEFLSGKSYVIVFDDIWKNEAWDDLKDSIPHNSEKGGRVIITSRDNGVGRYIGGECSLHVLEPLNSVDSWKLFSRRVMDPLGYNNETPVPEELEDTSQQIVSKCGGIPLAIIVTAGLLLSKERKVHAWKGVLESMGHDQNDKFAKILALSYKNLQSDLKLCFLYFGIFPEDHEICAYRLINLWVAEKFIPAIGDRTLEDVGEDKLDNLVARNLIQVVRRRFDGRIKSCRIHDLLHTFCIEEAKKSDFFSTLKNVTSYPDTRVRRVTTHGCSIYELISLHHRTPKLRSLLCFNATNSRGVKQFLDFKLLRVLDLQIENWFDPTEIGNFIHLSYLRLKGFGRMTLPTTIKNLKKLLTLDVRESHFCIPTCIWEMKQLRHIFLDCRVEFYTECGWFKKMDGFPIEVSLPNLQTLDFFWPVRLEFEPSLLHKFTSLRRLRIECISRRTEQIIEVLSASTPTSQHLENLWLRGRSGGDWTANLNLSRYHKLHKMETLKKLPKLKVLKLCEYLDDILDLSGADNFPQLEVLTIMYLWRVRQLIADEGGMPKLNKFTVSRISSKLDIILPERLRNIMQNFTRSTLKESGD